MTHAVITYHKEFNSVLVKYGLPAVFESMMTKFGILLLGMFIGKSDVGDIYASYTLVNNVYVALQAILNGLFVGVTVVLVRHSYREHDRHNSVASSYILLACLSTALVCALLAACSSGVLGVFYRNSEAHVFAGAVKMFPAFCIALFLELATLIFGACFRGVSNFKVPTAAMILMSVLSAAFGAVFVMYMKLGMAGIIATMILSRIIPLLFTVAVYIIGKSGIRPAKLCRGDFKEALESFVIGSLSMLEQFGIQVAYLILQSILVTVGTDTLTGYYSANSMISFIYVISTGLNLALVTACGQYYAERKLRKTKACAWYFTLVTYITAGTAGLICILFPKQIISLFLNPGNAFDIGVKILPLLAATLFVTTVFQVLPGLFKAIGDTRITCIIAVSGALCIRIPFAYLFIIVLKLEYVGIVLALSVDYLFRAIFYIIKTYRLFRKPVHQKHYV